MNQRRILFLLGGLAIFTVLLVIGVDVALRYVPPPTQNVLPPQNIEDKKIHIENPSGGNDTKVNILDEVPSDSRAITYTEAGFSPKEITIKITDSVGCLITIQNKTGVPLRVGVSPHNPAGDPGADYGEIISGETGILDVRYTGLPGVTLHDHAKPGNEFHVAYGEGCQ
jgi:hypothetical protein